MGFLRFIVFTGIAGLFGAVIVGVVLDYNLVTNAAPSDHDSSQPIKVHGRDDFYLPGVKAYTHHKNSDMSFTGQMIDYNGLQCFVAHDPAYGVGVSCNWDRYNLEAQGYKFHQRR